jgi:peptide/nickel transport system permease protein
MLKLLPKIGLRVVSSIITVLVIISAIFFILKAAPGNSEYKYLSTKLSAEAIQKITSDFKVNEGLFSEYFAFIKNILSGEFGYSLNFHKPVFDVILPKLLFTLAFTLVAFLIQLIFSFILAYYSAKYPNSNFDKLTKSITLISYSTPPFVSGLILIYLFSYSFGLFPMSGAYSYEIMDFNLLGKVFDLLKHLILPILVFALIQIPIYYNYLRESIRTVLSSTFILYMRSIGTKNSVVFRKHILPNSLNAVIAVAGTEVGVMLGGSLIIEVVFGLPGMGRLILTAISTNDFPLIIGCCLIASSIVILTSFASDILRVKIDKRLAKGLLN